MLLDFYNARYMTDLLGRVRGSFPEPKVIVFSPVGCDAERRKHKMVAEFCLTARCSTWLVAIALILLMGPVASSQTPTPTPTPGSNQTPTPLPQIDTMEPTPAEVARGGSVTFTGQNFPSNPDGITVFLNGVKAGSASLVSPDKTKFIFAVPRDLALGRYSVRVE